MTTRTEGLEPGQVWVYDGSLGRVGMVVVILSPKDRWRAEAFVIVADIPLNWYSVYVDMFNVYWHRVA